MCGSRCSLCDRKNTGSGVKTSTIVRRVKGHRSEHQSQVQHWDNGFTLLIPCIVGRDASQASGWRRSCTWSASPTTERRAAAPCFGLFSATRSHHAGVRERKHPAQRQVVLCRLAVYEARGFVDIVGQYVKERTGVGPTRYLVAHQDTKGRGLAQEESRAFRQWPCLIIIFFLPLFSIITSSVFYSYFFTFGPAGEKDKDRKSKGKKALAFALGLTALADFFPAAFIFRARRDERRR